MINQNNFKCLKYTFENEKKNQTCELDFNKAEIDDKSNFIFHLCAPKIQFQVISGSSYTAIRNRHTLHDLFTIFMTN